MNDSDRLIMLLGNAQYYREKFTQIEIEESERLKDSRTFSEDDQRILRESEDIKYIQGLTPRMMRRLDPDFIEKYPEMALTQNMSLCSTVAVDSADYYRRHELRTPFFIEEDIVALDDAAKSRGAPIHQFIHRLVAIKPNKKNKRMFSQSFCKALKSARSFDELAKVNSFDIRWIPGLEGYRFEKYNSTSQLWLGRKNMHAYRKQLLKKVLDLAEVLVFDDFFEIACRFARYNLPRYLKSYDDESGESSKSNSLYSHMFMHFGGRQDLIDKMFRLCLSKATFEECLKAYNQVHNGRVSVFAIIQMEKLAKTAEHHWTIAQIAHRRNNTKLWKRHLKKAAAKA